MVKLSKEFFKGNEVIFVGYSGKNQAFSKSIYEAFTNNGFKVYPVNNKENGSYDVKVYRHLEDMPKIPDTAYILLNGENTGKAVKMLINKGVKRILFQNAKNVHQSILEECAGKGVETAVGCPMMLYGSGIHRIHAFFAGVKR